MRIRKCLPVLFCMCLLDACSWDSSLYDGYVDGEVVVPCPPTSFVHYDDRDDAYYLVCVTGYHAVQDDNGDYYDAPQYDYCDVNGQTVSVSERVKINKNRSGQFIDANNRVLYEWEKFADYIKEYHQKPELSYIQITKKNTDESIEAIECYEKLHSSAECPEFPDAFAYDICPKQYNVCRMDVDDRYYCQEPQVECKNVKDCESLVGWKKGECRNNECIATECDNREDKDDWYHLENSVCVADTPQHCGQELSADGSPINCGANKCVQGKCKAACESNEHIYNNICEPDDIYNCGMHDNNCSRIVAGWDTGECKITEQNDGSITKVCVPNRCIVGYHLNILEDKDVVDPCNASNRCEAENCQCEGKDCLCVENRCDCTGTDCECTGDGCVQKTCENENCSCTGSHCQCDDAVCRCEGELCTCSGLGCERCENAESCERICQGKDCFSTYCKNSDEPICPDDACAEQILNCAYEYRDSFSAAIDELKTCVDDCAGEMQCQAGCEIQTGKKFMEDEEACWRYGYTEKCKSIEDEGEKAQCEASEFSKLQSCALNCIKRDDYSYDDVCIIKCLGSSCPGEASKEMNAPDGTEDENKVSCQPDTTLQCGEVPQVCACGEVCSMGECKSGCGSKEVLCKDGANYTCADPLTNVNYCGANSDCTQFTKCNAGETCFNGECKTQACPNQGETLCSVKNEIGEEVNKCINIMGFDEKQCGACNYVCSEHNLSHATSDTCSAGHCVYVCNSGYTNCGDEYTPNCILEANFKTDANNCGKCGEVCKGNEYCHEGKCVTSKCAASNQCLDAASGECVNRPAQCGTQCIDCNTANHAAAGECNDGVCNITKCAAGYHLKGDICEQDTNVACGVNVLNCNTTGNATAGVCTDGVCSATACKPAFHLDNGKCVADSETACGSTANNCTSLFGWKSGKCTNASCVATACKDNYCLSGTTCMDGSSNSKACGTNGGACQACGAKEACVAGSCVTSSCNANVCFYQGKTCLNSDAHCGTDCINCNMANHAASGTCNASGACVVKTCAAGYHLYNNSCEADTTTVCGTDRHNCNNHNHATSGVCSGGTCVAKACTTGYHLSGGACVADSTTACGSGIVNCTKLSGWKAGTCTGGVCKATSCDAGYCVSSGTCVDGSANAKSCGTGGGNCSTCLSGQLCISGACKTHPCPANTCYWQGATCANANDHCGTNCTNCNTANHASSGTCTSGSCKITACAAGYHLHNNECEADSNTVCGSGRVNCNSAGNATAGVCSHGTCVATACKAGYHLNAGKCDADTTSACSGMNCTKLPGWKEGTCTGGSCKATKCKTDYCVSDNACVAGRTNTTACGKSGGACVNCSTSIAHTSSTHCVDGACKVLACKSGYCISDNQCVNGASNNNACGTNGGACKKCPSGQTCQSGTCKSS